MADALVLPLVEVRVSERRLGEVRARLVKTLAEMYPASGDQATPARKVTRETEFVTNEDGVITGKREVEVEGAPAAPMMPILTDHELRIAAAVPFVTRTAPGVLSFDWQPVADAVGRRLSSLDLRVLREGAVHSAQDEVDDDLDQRLLVVAGQIGDDLSDRLIALAASIDGATV